jgi:1-acyl-sn-glycerol-3-phosphate acyltransferase
MTALRSLAFNIVMFGAGAGLSLCARLVKRFRPESVLDFGMLWARISLRALAMLCGVQIQVEGTEYLPKSGPALIAAQHQSAFDTLVWLQLLPRPAYVLKRELLDLPLLGPLLIPSGFIAVDRTGGSAALRKMVADCRAAVAQSRQIVIFPEGTRVPPGTRTPLQPGVVALAHALGLPVIPVATNSGIFWGRNAFHKRAGLLRIKIYPPLPAGSGRVQMLAALTEIFYETGVDNSVEEAVSDFVNESSEKS